MNDKSPKKIYIDRLDAESRDVVMCFKDTEGGDDIIYIREDLFTDMTAERDRLRSALVSVQHRLPLASRMALSTIISNALTPERAGGEA